MLKLDKVIGTLVVVFLVIALVISGCAPKVSGEKVVKIGNRVTLTGALASMTLYHAYANFDYIAELNEHGGLDGIIVEQIWEDSASLGVREITAHRRFAEKGVVLEITTLVTGVELTPLKQQQDEIPCWFLGMFTHGMITPGERWVFTVAPSYAGSAATLMKWVKEEVWQEERLPRWGLIFYEAGVGWDTLDGFKEGARMGYGEFVGHEVVPILAAIDTSVEWLRLASEKPDYIYAATYGSTTVALVKDAARLGIREKGINLFNCLLSINEPMIEIISPEDAEGWYGYSSAALNTETEIPALMTVLDAGNKYRGWAPEKVPANYILIWHSTAVVLEGLRRAIEKVGLENLTGRDVRDSLATLKGYDTGLAAQVDISDKRPYGNNGWKVHQIKGGRLYPVSDWLECIYHHPELEK